MGKKTKEHKKKVSKRNDRIKQERNRMDKIQKDFLMQLINMEKEKGAFNSPVQPMSGFDVPNLSDFNGPQI
jgi:hypothetical protein